MFECAYCHKEFEDKDKCISLLDNFECCPDCSTYDFTDGYYTCEKCWTGITLKELTFDDDGRAFHEKCLEERKNQRFDKSQ